MEKNYTKTNQRDSRCFLFSFSLSFRHVSNKYASDRMLQKNKKIEIIIKTEYVRNFTSIYYSEKKVLPFPHPKPSPDV